jgi:hypothetical protein
MNDADWIKRGLVAFFVLCSAAVFVYWPIALAGGAFPDGVLAFQPLGNVPLAHLCAEFLMAGVTLIAAVAWGLRQPWGAPLLLFGLGMFSYGTLNALGWALYESPPLAVLMALVLGGSMLALPRLIHGLTRR